MIFSLWLVAAVSALISGVVSSYILVKNHERYIEQQLKATATTLISLGISDYHGLKGFQVLDSFIDESLKLGRVERIIQVFTKKGKLMFSSPAVAQENFKEIFKPTEQPSFQVFDGKTRDYKVLTMPYRATTGKKYFLHIATPFPYYRDILRSAMWEALLLLVVLCVFSFFVSQWLAKRLMRPVSHYLAHEIRTPLTIMTGEAEMVLRNEQATVQDYQQVLKSSLEEIDRIKNVVNAVLRMSQKGKEVFEKKPCDLALWLEEQLVRWEKYLGRRLSWQKPNHPILVLLDTELLYRLLDNLIRNIKEHTPPHAPCRLSLHQDYASTHITLEDGGAGIAPDILEALNKRQGSYDKVGIGLGLCLEIASICNFKMSFANKSDGGLLVDVVVE